MKRKIICILFLSLLPIAVTAQNNLQVEDYLQKIFQGFPIGVEEKEALEYISLNNFIASPNIYDSTKTDYRKIIKTESTYLYQPYSATIEYFYAYGWGYGKGEVGNAQITVLGLNYGESTPENCINQFKELIYNLKGQSAKSENYYLSANAGRIGEIFEFYKSRKDKYPFLTISLIYKSCTASYCHISIAYLKQLAK